MATDYFVDKTNGLDTNPGTLAQPFQTIVKGLQTASGFSGDRIFIRKGLYQEGATLEAQTVGTPLIGYEEDVTIDAEGSYQRATGQIAPFSAGQLMLQNLKIVNYTLEPAQFTGGMGYKVDNCFFKPAQSSGSFFLNPVASGAMPVQLQDVTIVGHGTVFNNFTGAISGFIKNCIIHDNVALGMTLNGDAAVTYSAYPGATGATNINSTTTSPGFVSAGGGNYALAASSALRGAGEKGTNMGATFQPALRIGTGLTNTFASPDWDNDPLWWDPTLNGGLGGAGLDAIAAGATPGPALFQGGKWQIDTGSQPTATSARIRSKVYQFATTVTIKNVGWGADEDESPSTGSKLVIDNSIGTSTRQIEIRGAITSFLVGDGSPSWTLVSKSQALSLSAVYCQGRMTMTIVGT